MSESIRCSVRTSSLWKAIYCSRLISPASNCALTCAPALRRISSFSAVVSIDCARICCFCATSSALPGSSFRSAAQLDCNAFDCTAHSVTPKQILALLQRCLILTVFVFFDFSGGISPIHFRLHFLENPIALQIVMYDFAVGLPDHAVMLCAEIEQHSRIPVVNLRQRKPTAHQMQIEFFCTEQCAAGFAAAVQPFFASTDISRESIGETFAQTSRKAKSSKVSSQSSTLSGMSGSASFAMM